MHSRFLHNTLALALILGILAAPFVSFAQEEDEDEVNSSAAHYPSAERELSADFDEQNKGGGGGINVSGVGGVIMGCTGLSGLIAGAVGGLVSSLVTVPTTPVALTGKEGCSDSIAGFIAKQLLAAMTASIVNWINSGFHGDPTFISDPGAFFLDVANEITGKFMRDTALAPFCDAFKPQILIALAQTQTYRQRAKCTLLDAVGNVEGFFNDFSQGGWAGWLTMTQQPQNNPFGAYLIALDERSTRLAYGLQNKQSEVNQGAGFRALKKCVRYDSLYTYDTQNYAQNLEEYNVLYGASGQISKDGIVGCLETVTITPGRAIADALNDSTTKSTTDQLISADEINEALGAVFDALINQFITKGVRSLSKRGNDGSVTSSWNDPTAELDGIRRSFEEVRANVEEYFLTLDETDAIKEETLAVLDEVIACYGVGEGEGIPPVNPARVPAFEDKKRKIKDSMGGHEKEKVAIEVVIPKLDELIERASTTKDPNEVSALVTEYSQIGPLLPSEASIINAQTARAQAENEKASVDSELVACIALRTPPPVEVICVEGTCTTVIEQQQQ